MKLGKVIVLAFCMALLSPLRVAAQEASLDSLLNFVRDLSNSRFEGRLAGTDGFLDAADYVVNALQRFGVQPYKGEWAQYFETECNKIENCTFNSYINPNDRQIYVLGRDFSCVGMSGRGYADAPVVFCGYGIDHPSFNEYAKVVSGRYIVHRLRQSRVYTGSTAGRMNTAVDFKIIVKDSEGVIDFTNDDYAQQIKSICVKVAELKFRDQDGNVELLPPATFSFTPEYMSDCIMLKTDGKGVTDGNINDFNEIASFYIEIHWKDESVSYIPLIKSTDGIDISLKDTQNEGDDFTDTVPFVYTVTLTTATGREHMADEIYLGNNKKRE